jgi:hypothetical protein
MVKKMWPPFTYNKQRGLSPFELENASIQWWKLTSVLAAGVEEEIMGINFSLSPC